MILDSAFIQIICWIGKRVYSFSILNILPLFGIVTNALVENLNSKLSLNQTWSILRHLMIADVQRNINLFSGFGYTNVSNCIKMEKVSKFLVKFKQVIVRIMLLSVWFLVLVLLIHYPYVSHYMLILILESESR